MALKKGDKVVEEDFWLNGSQCAKACGVTLKTFTTWNIPHVAEGTRNQKFYLIEDIVANRVAYALKSAKKSGGISSDEAKDAMDAAKLDEINERTENMAIKNAILRRENAPISALEFALGKVCAQISAILDSIPVKVKRACPKLGSADIEKIKAEIVKCQNVAAEAKIDLDDME